MKRVGDLGLHGTEALMMAGAVTTTIKLVAGRARPSKNPENPSDYKLFRGFKGHDYVSFPSGHTTGAFAAAAAVTAEANRCWPGSRWYVEPAMFAGASLVGMSDFTGRGEAAVGGTQALQTTLRRTTHTPDRSSNRPSASA